MDNVEKLSSISSTIRSFTLNKSTKISSFAANENHANFTLQSIHINANGGLSFTESPIVPNLNNAENKSDKIIFGVGIELLILAGALSLMILIFCCHLLQF